MKVEKYKIQTRFELKVLLEVRRMRRQGKRFENRYIVKAIVGSRGGTLMWFIAKINFKKETKTAILKYIRFLHPSDPHQSH